MSDHGLAWNGDKGDLDSPDERVVTCGLRVDRLQAQLDRIEAKIDHLGVALGVCVRLPSRVAPGGVVGSGGDVVQAGDIVQADGCA